MSIGSVGITENVLQEDCLDLSNGILVKSLKELVAALKKMNSDAFELHVTKNRNDFAEWILEAYNDEKLAKKILRNLDKRRIIKILESALETAPKLRIEKKDMRIRSSMSKKIALKNIGEIGGQI